MGTGTETALAERHLLAAGAAESRAVRLAVSSPLAECWHNFSQRCCKGSKIADIVTRLKDADKLLSKMEES